MELERLVPTNSAADVGCGLRAQRLAADHNARNDLLRRDGVIGDGADIGARCELLRGARVWPGVVIPDCGIRYSSDI